MSTAQTVLLGAVAGVTIFLGLPVGRVRGARLGPKAFLNGISAGILVFLLFDILEHSVAPVEEALESARDGAAGWGRFAGLSAVLAVGIGLGLLGLLLTSRLWRRRRVKGSLGPGAMALAEATGGVVDRKAEALRVGMGIAAGIGLHNFSEGLAIGQTAHAGEISLALLLVVGFALHNATEGFGIVGPLAAAGVRPTWAWLATMGLVGGGPTFLGTLLGTSISSEFVFVAFLALAAGAILYVLGELFAAGRRLSWDITLWGILIGFLVGLATDFVLVAAGA